MYVPVKRCIDVAGALVGLGVFSPALAIVAIAIRLKMGRPILFCQVRPGLHCKLFVLYKFRTMADTRDVEGNLLPDTARLTPLGKFLRRTSLDELPQLWNVLKGDMSLIGPRPLFAAYLPCYTKREQRRHDVRPGITGLAQISGRNRLGWDERLELDARYVERLGFALDTYILLKTVWKVLTRSDIGEGWLPDLTSRLERPL